MHSLYPACGFCQHFVPNLLNVLYTQNSHPSTALCDLGATQRFEDFTQIRTFVKRQIPCVFVILTNIAFRTYPNVLYRKKEHPSTAHCDLGATHRIQGLQHGTFEANSIYQHNSQHPKNDTKLSHLLFIYDTDSSYLRTHDHKIETSCTQKTVILLPHL